MITKIRRRLHQGLANVPPGFDHWLLLACAILIGLSLIMVSSASVVIADQRFGFPFYFSLRHSIYMVLGIGVFLWTLRIPIRAWERYSQHLLILTLVLLALVLVPGVGRHVNGSSRWLGAGPFTIQVSEIAKFTLIIYFSGFIHRRQSYLKNNFFELFKPLSLLAVIALLLLLEPDFGATVVIGATTMGLLFIGGVSLRYFLLLSAVALGAAAVLAVSSPYRVLRLTSFLNPWADQFNSGYQLTQALIALGRGQWFGVGLGNSVQKLLYLPEAHTDFLVAVLGEEFGLVGMIFLLMVYTLLITRIFLISKKAFEAREAFAGFIAVGAGLWLGLQTFINLGVNMGVLPTKGLTLPLMSYGGSSIVVILAMLGLVFRIEYETRLKWFTRKTEARLGPFQRANKPAEREAPV